MIAMIVAHSRNRVIGRNGRLPWRIPGELLRYKRLTMGQAVIMGRRSFEEVGKALPGRLNIVLSSAGDYTSLGCLNARSLEEAIRLAGDRDVYISGGARVFQEGFALADKLYITEIDAEVEGDTYFPEFDASLYTREVEARFDGDMPYDYVTYTRIR